MNAKPRPAPILLFTIDVEEDMPRWNITNPITVENARALPGLQEICDEFGVRPTYLCNYPMVVQQPSAGILQKLHASGRCEIGTHLHPWNTPPFNGIPGKSVDEQTIAYYLRDLGPGKFRAKLDLLTKEIQQLTGIRPLTFRAGRYGIDGPTLRVVQELGYTVDTSVTPLAEHTADGGPDFRSAPQIPYRPSGDDVRHRGNLQIVEVPVSIALTRRVPRSLSNLYVHLPRWTRLRGILSSDFLNIVDYAWLYPVRFNLKQMQLCARSLIAHGSPVLNVFLHSSELVPGVSGAVHTPEDARRCVERIRGILQFCVQDLGARPMTLAECGPEMNDWIDAPENQYN